MSLVVVQSWSDRVPKVNGIYRNNESNDAVVYVPDLKGQFLAESAKSHQQTQTHSRRVKPNAAREKECFKPDIKSKSKNNESNFSKNKNVNIENQNQKTCTEIDQDRSSSPESSAPLPSSRYRNLGPELSACIPRRQLKFASNWLRNEDGWRRSLNNSPVSPSQQDCYSSEEEKASPHYSSCSSTTTTASSQLLSPSLSLNSNSNSNSNWNSTCRPQEITVVTASRRRTASPLSQGEKDAKQREGGPRGTKDQVKDEDNNDNDEKAVETETATGYESQPSIHQENYDRDNHNNHNNARTIIIGVEKKNHKSHCLKPIQPIQIQAWKERKLGKKHLNNNEEEGRGGIIYGNDNIEIDHSFIHSSSVYKPRQAQEVDNACRFDDEIQLDTARQVKKIKPVKKSRKANDIILMQVPHMEKLEDGHGGDADGNSNANNKNLESDGSSDRDSARSGSPENLNYSGSGSDLESGTFPAHPKQKPAYLTPKPKPKPTPLPRNFPFRSQESKFSSTGRPSVSAGFNELEEIIDKEQHKNNQKGIIKMMKENESENENDTQNQGAGCMSSISDGDEERENNAATTTALLLELDLDKNKINDELLLRVVQPQTQRELESSSTALLDCSSHCSSAATSTTNTNNTSTSEAEAEAQEPKPEHETFVNIINTSNEIQRERGERIKKGEQKISNTVAVVNTGSPGRGTAVDKKFVVVVVGGEKNAVIGHGLRQKQEGEGKEEIILKAEETQTHKLKKREETAEEEEVEEKAKEGFIQSSKDSQSQSPVQNSSSVIFIPSPSATTITTPLPSSWSSTPSISISLNTEPTITSHEQSTSTRRRNSVDELSQARDDDSLKEETSKTSTRITSQIQIDKERVNKDGNNIHSENQNNKTQLKLLEPEPEQQADDQEDSSFSLCSSHSDPAADYYSDSDSDQVKNYEGVCVNQKAFSSSFSVQPIFVVEDAETREVEKKEKEGEILKGAQLQVASNEGLSNIKNSECEYVEALKIIVPEPQDSTNITNVVAAATSNNSSSDENVCEISDERVRTTVTVCSEQDEDEFTKNYLPVISVSSTHSNPNPSSPLPISTNVNSSSSLSSFPTVYSSSAPASMTSGTSTTAPLNQDQSMECEKNHGLSPIAGVKVPVQAVNKCVKTNSDSSDELEAEVIWRNSVRDSFRGFCHDLLSASSSANNGSRNINSNAYLNDRRKEDQYEKEKERKSTKEGSMNENENESGWSLLESTMVATEEFEDDEDEEGLLNEDDDRCSSRSHNNRPECDNSIEYISILDNIQVNEVMYRNQGQVNTPAQKGGENASELHPKPIKWIISLDLGSKWSGFAYWSYCEPEVIHIGSWSGDGCNHKIPSWITYYSSVKNSSNNIYDTTTASNQMKNININIVEDDGSPTNKSLPSPSLHDYFLKNNNGVKVGQEALDKYTESQGKNSSQFVNQWREFLESDSATTGGAPGNALDFGTVLSSFIFFFGQAALRQLQSKFSTHFCKNDPIEWILTVPSTWKSSSRNLIRDSALNSGVIKSNDGINLIEDPMAASFFASAMCRGEYENFLALDIGGAFLHYTAFELRYGYMHQIIKPRSLLLPTPEQTFENLLVQIVSHEFILHYQSKFKPGWIRLMKNFEDAKCKFDNNNGSGEKDGSSAFVFLPSSFVIEFHRYTGVEISECLAEHNSGISWNINGALSIPAHEMRMILKPTLSFVINQVESILKHDFNGNLNIVLTGGFAKNRFFKEAMKSKFREKFLNKELSLMLPKEFANAVLQGATLSLMPNMRTPKLIIKSPFSIGVGVLKTFDPEIHPEEKRIVKDGKSFCGDAFDVLMVCGQRIELNSVVSKRSYVGSQPGQASLVLPLFKSSSSTPRLVTEKSVQKCCELRFESSNHVWQEIDLILSCRSSELVIQAFESGALVHRVVIDLIND